MSALLDTLVLVAALAPDQNGHAECLALLMKGGGTVYSHAFLETFSTLTGGRLGIKVDADLAARLLNETVLPRIHVIELGAAEVLEALRLAKKQGVRGGGVYDYMHLTAARKALVDVIYTLNLDDFSHLRRGTDPDIQRP